MLQRSALKNDNNEQSDINDYITSRFNSESTCCSSLQNLSYTRTSQMKTLNVFSQLVYRR
jgi:hypothetical protein